MAASLTFHQSLNLLKKNDLYISDRASDLEYSDLVTSWSDLKIGEVGLIYKGVNFDPHSEIKAIIAKSPRLLILETVGEDLQNSEIPFIQVNNGRAAWSVLMNALHPHSDKLKFIGVTGTNGKTSTVWFLKQLFDSASVPSCSIGTLGTYLNQTKIEGTHTTPDPSQLYPIFEQAKDCQYVFMEVSSHAMEQEKLRPIKFDTSIITSFSQDHLDLHGSMEAYWKAKERLFTENTKENALMLSHHSLSQRFPMKTSTYGLDSNLSIANESIHGSEITVSYRSETKTYHCPIVGTYFCENLTAALMVFRHFMGDWPSAEAVQKIAGVPGRLQKVSCEQSEVQVFVDYAHTPDALWQTTHELKTLSKAHLITVFGCGGDRDRSKRPLMLEAAAEHSDEIYITSDNPRGENPAAIIAEIMRGSNKGKTTHCQEDRQIAIQNAILNAKSDSVILIAGKGHEDYQIIGETKTHFDDCEVAQKALELRDK